MFNNVIAAGSGGVGSRGDWSFNVDQAVLTILKGGVTAEQILEALLKGKKIKDLLNYVQKCKESGIDVVFDSFLNYEDDDMGKLNQYFSNFFNIVYRQRTPCHLTYQSCIVNKKKFRQ